MRLGLPSLYALQIFEAAARHDNFTRAAEEFRISQGAVSHQIKALEADLGVSLFSRSGRTVKVTKQGADLAKTVHDSLLMIRAQTEQISRSAIETTLEVEVATTTYFASRWLSGRLTSFMRDFPDVGVSIVHRPTDPRTQPASIEIRWGDGSWDSAHSELLFEKELYLVCSPTLLKSATGYADAATLAEHPFLHDDETHNAWRRWLSIAGYEGLLSPRGPTISDPNVRMQAAVDGQGFALADDLLASELQSGSLVAPFKSGVSGYGFHLLTHDEPLSPSELRFVEWLRREARAYVEDSERDR